MLSTPKRDAASAEGVNTVASTENASTGIASVDLSAVSAALWLAATVFLALLALYFVGIDQGAASLFGSDSHVHEFVHDARHLLGFPCH
jgi:Probable cobalt transporter subunit (CbtB)